MVQSLLSGTVGCVLLASGVLKVVQPGAFRTFVEELRLVPGHSRSIVTAVSVLEIASALLLVSPGFRLGAAAAATMSSAFVAIAIVAARRRSSHGCGCFGSLDSRTPHWLTIGRAALLAASAFGCAITSFGSHSARPASAPFLLAIGFLAGGGLAAAGVVVSQVATFVPTLRALLGEEVSSVRV